MGGSELNANVLYILQLRDLKMEYVHHPLIREKTVERRAYQISIAATALMHNTLVILPTGLGKTVIALLVMASRLHNKGGRVLMLAPTKPLVEQHAEFLRRTLKIHPSQIVALSGEIPPEKRLRLWKEARVVVSTPQVIENDLISGRISLEDVVHITFDEAHRAVGNYSYVFIARNYLKNAKDPLVLGLTASPGSDFDRIREVVENLGIEEIEIRTELDPDVRPYVHGKRVEWVKVEMPKEFKEIRDALKRCVELRFMRLEGLGVSAKPEMSKKELLALQERIHMEAVESGDQRLFEASSVLAEILKIQHGIELLETQGLSAFKNYVKRMVMEAKSRGGSRAAKSIVVDPAFKRAVIKALRCKVEHPKVEKLKEIVKEQMRERDSRVIVFTNYRDTADVIAKALREMGIPAVRFVGQADRANDRGMRQREQIEVVERFRRGEIRVLVATSVGEEGLDIPETDLVVFYEPVPSEIRAIQRKGRTGRAREGRIVVLIAEGTRDEVYYRISVRKERLMFERIYGIKEKLKGIVRKRDEIVGDEDVKIYVDSREMRSEVVKRLYEMGVRIDVMNLDVGDYVLSDRVAVERKTVDDFLNSLANRTLLDQLLRLRRAYQRPVLIIEGNGLYKRMNPNSIRGVIATIAVDIGIPIITTSDPKETAEMLVAIAKREQRERGREFSPHSGKTKRTLREQQEYVVSAISEIGPVLARNLLEHFQTIEKIATASEDELMRVPKVGKKLARRIRLLMTTPYSKADEISLDDLEDLK